MAVVSVAFGDTIDLTADQLTSETFNPVPIVVTANKLIALGQQNAYASLLQYAEQPVDKHQPMQRMYRDYYVAWLSLLVYDPKPGSGLPWPQFGGPGFPDTGDFGDDTRGRMNKETWPRFPLALSRGVPFLLVRGGYMLAGEAESGFVFLKRCQANGTFHATPYSVPTHTEEEVALNELISSPQWRALQWHESTSPNYLHANENREIEFLRQQVERVK